MNITIEAKNFELTPSLRIAIEDKLGKLARFSDRIERIGIELEVDHAHVHGLIHRAEVWVYLPEMTLQAGHRAEPMSAAIDHAADKVERQIVDHERKRRDQHRPSRI